MISHYITTKYFVTLGYDKTKKEVVDMEPAEMFELLTEENKKKFSLFVAQLAETQDSCPPLPDSRDSDRDI